MTALELSGVSDEGRFGAKAVNLGRAMRAGLPVPPGFALDVELVRSVASGDPAARREVSRAFAALAGPAAIRSSAVGEDSGRASFAGQHLSVLNVASSSDAVEAVAAVELSGRGAGALAYRRAAGVAGPARMAVVLQRLVAADAAGVLFTRNPVDGRDERLIEAALLGLAVFAGGAVTAAAAGGLAALVAGRLAMAAGGAVTMPAMLALGRVRSDPAHRNRTFGTVGAALGLAAALGPTLGAVVVTGVGWRAVFAANLPVAAVAALLLAPAARRSPPAGAATLGVDLPGALLLALAVVPAAAGATAWAALATAGAALAAFAWWELRAPIPLVEVRLFARRELAAAAAGIGLHNFVQYALLFQLPFELARSPGGAQASGRVLMALLLGLVAGGPLGARLADACGARAALAGGSLLGLVGFAVLPDLSGATSALTWIPGLALLGAGIGLASAPAQAVALAAVEPERAGVAAGALSTARYLGGLLGVALLARRLDDSTPPRAWPWLDGLALVIAAALALAVPGRSGREAPPRPRPDAGRAPALAGALPRPRCG